MLLLLKMPSFVMQMMTKIRASLGIRPDSTATSERSALVTLVNPFAPGDFAEKRVLKLVEWFSGHCRAIKS